MAGKVAPGQVWREEATGSHFLVTRVYQDLFDHFALLRRVDKVAGAVEETRRLKLSRNPPPLPGYVQEAAEFHLE